MIVLSLIIKIDSYLANLGDIDNQCIAVAIRKLSETRDMSCMSTLSATILIN